jgi:lia operon protein LiaG
MRTLLFSGITLVALAASLAAQATERRAVPGTDVAIYNLAGVVRVEAGSGADVVVEITRGGADAAQLRLETGEIRGQQTLRVIYPADDITYGDPGRWGDGETTLDVRDDGTFNDQHDRHFFRSGRRVRISGRGRGLDAHADLRILVPAGKQVAVYLAVGKATVSNVDGDIRLDVASADVEASHTKGSLYLDTGSGSVRVTDVAGDIILDTGSGDVTVTGITGGRVKLETGSGGVTATRVEADELKVDTGSGDVDVSDVKARAISLDTGSGSVGLGLLTRFETLDVDTGSGEVTIRVPADFGAVVDIETGSGGIDMGGVPVTVTRMESDHIIGRIGDGRGRMKVETGSGGVRLVKS